MRARNGFVELEMFYLSLERGFREAGDGLLELDIV